MAFGKVYDVLIVGAGPVGLSTAIALDKRGVNNILVIDQARSFRPVGQVIDLLPNGLKALRCINEQVYQDIKAAGLTFLQSPQTNHSSQASLPPQKRVWYTKNLQGKVILSIPLDFDYWLDRYGEGRVSLSWYELQTILRNILPSEMVQANHRCVNFTQKEDSILIDCTSDEAIPDNPFAHWKTQSSDNLTEQDSSTKTLVQKQFEAKVVVAADGINSKIRQILYRDLGLNQWAKPKYAGWSAIGCLHIENIPDPMMQDLEDQYFTGNGVVTLRNDALTSNDAPDFSPRLILIRTSQNSLGYLLHISVSLEDIQNQSRESLINLAAKKVTENGFPTIFSQLIHLSNPETLIHRPYYIHPVHLSHHDPIWSHKRLVLVGDAAHGMPPFAAQGANQGLEDAAIVGTAIADLVVHNALDNCERITHKFIQYEQLRRPFLETIQDATLKHQNFSQSAWEQNSNRVYSRNLEDVMGQFSSNSNLTEEKR